jgi:outer membrane immunogenic protein
VGHRHHDSEFRLSNISRTMQSNVMGEMMRGSRLTSVGLATALALAATGASAEGFGDRGSVKDGRYAAPLNWTGFHVAAAAAYGIGVTDLVNDGTDGFDTGLRGVQGVLAIGYDWQLSPLWVLGVFGDYAFGEIEGAFDAADDTFTIDKQWAVGGRLGLLATPSTLLYASAGYTRADFEVSGNTLNITDKETMDGYFVGLGVEQAISRNLALKIDYRFSDYKEITSIELATARDELASDVHSLRLGLTWKFGRDDRGLIK